MAIRITQTMMTAGIAANANLIMIAMSSTERDVNVGQRRSLIACSRLHVGHGVASLSLLSA